VMKEYFTVLAHKATNLYSDCVREHREINLLELKNELQGKPKEASWNLPKMPRKRVFCF
jgi:hypothetical protein